MKIHGRNILNALLFLLIIIGLSFVASINQYLFWIVTVYLVIVSIPCAIFFTFALSPQDPHAGFCNVVVGTWAAMRIPVVGILFLPLALISMALEELLYSLINLR